MPNRSIDICKTEKERNADSKNLDIGVGDFMIPNNAKKQRIGSNSKGGIMKYSHPKRHDAFRKENRAKDFKFSI